LFTTISVPCEDDGSIAKSFEKATQFKVYIVEEDGTISRTEIAPFKGHGAAAHAMDLGAKVTNLLICDQIKEGSRLATAEANIRLLTGNCGNADECVQMHIAQNHHINTGMWGKGTVMAGGGVLQEKHQEYLAKKAEQAKEGRGLRSLFGKKDK
jgi:predicted Fe-Mo cluster-binding NifX family protein